MGHKNKRRHGSQGQRPAAAIPPGGHASGAPADGSPSDLPPGEVAEVARFIAEGNTKAALQTAKTIHGRLDSPQSEAFLVDTYILRIQAMASAGLTTEAKSLEELVAERYSCGRRKLEEARQSAPFGGESLADAVAKLGQADLPDEQRVQIEDRIHGEATDLAALSACGHLPAEHAIRQAAGALWRAFQAVTSGPVTDEQIALLEVSRRSPLADWKLLVRAIACFYRNEDDACRRVLESMDASSAAGRLIAPLRAMMDGPAGRGEAVGALSPAGRLLAAGVGGQDEALRQAMADLEGVFQRGQDRKVCEGIRRAVERCQSARPELLVRLRQILWVRASMMDCSERKVASALQGPVIHDAHFFRLLARDHERVQDPCGACAIWDRFRVHAVHEGWFPADGPEVAAVYLHMADLLRRMPPKEEQDAAWRFREAFPGFGVFYDASQPPSVRALAPAPRAVDDFYFLTPFCVFERACTIQPHADLFSRWLDWARGSGSPPAVLEDIAERWHRAVPTDNRPLLSLMYGAEERRAFTKALKYLEQAEALDAVSPAVKRARLRLWVAKAMRHVHENKAHLAAKDFAAIDELPQAREGDRPAMVAALRWFAATRFGDEQAATELDAELVRLFGGKGPAVALLGCIEEGGARNPRASASDPLPAAGPELVQAVGRACLLGEDFEIKMAVPRRWMPTLEQALAEGPGPHDPAALRALAEVALAAGGALGLVFAAAGAGLRMGGPTRARFLLLRGESLPWQSARRQECLDVAVELARRQRDMDLLAEAIDAARGYSQLRHAEDMEVDEAFVEAVLARETAARKLTDPVLSMDSKFAPRQPGRGGRKARPNPNAPQPLPFDTDEESVVVPELGDEDELDDWDDEDDEDDWDEDEEDFWDDEDDEDDEDDWDEDGEGFPDVGPPVEIMNMMGELLKRCGGKLPGPQETQRILDSDPALRARMEQLVKKYGPPMGLDGPGGMGGPPGGKKPKRKGKR